MSKPILFVDFDGTLCHERFWRNLPETQYLRVQELLFGEDRSYLQDWMRGKHTAEEVNSYVAENINVPPEDLWEIFVNDAETMSVSSEALQLISDLRDRYTPILITVNMDSFSRFTVPALKLNDYFDAISNSFYEGIFKVENDGEVFKKYLNQYGAPVHESILMDDSVAACEAFKSLGGTANLVTSEEDVIYHLRKLAAKG